MAVAQTSCATARCSGVRLAGPASRRARALTRHCSRNVPACRAGQAEAPPGEAAAAFADLAAARLDRCAVSLQPCAQGQGNGLFLTEPAATGDVVLSVPLDCCLVVDYAAGMRLPQGAWPRLQRGVQKDAELPWDILQALALLDSLAGGGDAFWDRYSNAVLPQPLEMTLPTCMPPDLLPELQHVAIVAGAQAQQERLAGLFPGLAASMCQGGPSWLQWGFGCVRSRAFKLRGDCFASVPFLDVANHADDPACDFRLSGDGSCVELVALKALQGGQEASISYTGIAGMTSQRLMAQYGFVPRGGNAADRLQFATLAAAAVPGGGGGSSPPVLSLDRMQACFGDGDQMAAAMSGRDPFAYAALKSLPFSTDDGTGADMEDQLALAGRLRVELAAEAAAWPTSLAGDSALLQQLQQQQPQGGDARLRAAVEYRLQRKALAKTCMRVLDDFVRGEPSQ